MFSRNRKSQMNPTFDRPYLMKRRTTRSSRLSPPPPPRPIEFLESRTLLAAGQLDLSFGNLGQVAYPIQTNLQTQADSIVRQADGKVLVAGRSSVMFTAYQSVARYTAAGQLDTTFGNGGRVLLRDIYLPSNQPATVLVQKSGRILVGVGGSNEFRVFALRPDGATDRSFGVNGVAKVPLLPNWSYLSQSAATLLADQSVMIGGTMYFWDSGGTVTRAGWVHILADGRVDPDYNGAMRDLQYQGGDSTLARLAPLPDGNVLAVGQAGGEPMVVKIGRGGALDWRFGTTYGVARVDFGRAADFGSALTVLPGGDIIVGGSSDNDFALGRLTAAGKRVGSFGAAGTARFDAGGAQEGAVAITQSAGGRLLVTGADAVVAFTQAGKLDAGYGTGGKVAVNLGPSKGLAVDAVAGPGDSLLVAGRAGSADFAGGTDLFAIERLTAAGKLDTTFAPGTATPGIVTTPFPAAAEVFGTYVVRQGDGKTVLFATDKLSSQAVDFVRLNVDGTPDRTFGDGGRTRVTVDLSMFGGGCGLAIDSRGRILGLVRPFGSNVTVIRLRTDGKLDTTFGAGGRLQLELGDGSYGNAGMAVVAGDRLVVGISGVDGISFARIDDTGRLDAAFGVGGRVNVKVAGALAGSSVYVQQLLALPGGKVLAVGGTYVPVSSATSSSLLKFTAVRLTASGAPDATFGNNGSVISRVDAGDNAMGSALDATALPDGRVLLVGYSESQMPNGVSPRRVAAVMYKANGTLDPTFNAGGRLLLTLRPGAFESATAVIRQPDGTFVMAGWSQSMTGTDSLPAAVRITPAGKLDPTFANQGVLLLNEPGNDRPIASDLLLQPDGKIVLAGSKYGAITAWRLLDEKTPAPAARVVNGVLTVTGTPGADLIRLVRSGNTLSLTGFPTTFAVGTFSRIAVNALGGNDRVDAVNVDLPLGVDGGDGDDVILGGAGRETLLGGAGNDTLFGGRGDDVIHGGDGNDYISGGPGRNALYGDAGNDQIFALNTLPDVVDGGGGFDRARYDAYDSRKSIEALLA